MIIKNKTFLLFILLLQAFLFFSCQTNRTSSHLNKVYVTNTNPVDLMETKAITSVIDKVQIFEGDFGEKFFSTVLALYADVSAVNIVMLNEMGIEVGSIDYDGKNCTIDSSFFPKNLKAEYIILDLQNAYADFFYAASHYKKYGLLFEKEENRRLLSRNGRLIEEIIYEGKVLTIKNHLRGYTYKLTDGE